MLPPIKVLRLRLADPLTRETTIIQIADFYRDLVLFMGAEMETAALVGLEITRGLSKEWKADEQGTAE